MLYEKKKKIAIYNLIILAIRNTTGHYYLNGNWRIDFPRSLRFAGTIFHYGRDPQGFSAPDMITALGPTTEAIYLVVSNCKLNFFCKNILVNVGQSKLLYLNFSSYSTKTLMSVLSTNIVFQINSRLKAIRTAILGLLMNFPSVVLVAVAVSNFFLFFFFMV